MSLILTLNRGLYIYGGLFYIWHRFLNWILQKHNIFLEKNFFFLNNVLCVPENNNVGKSQSNLLISDYICLGYNSAL